MIVVIWFFFLRLFLPIVLVEMLVLIACHLSKGKWRWKNKKHFFILFLLIALVIGIQFPNSFFLSLIVLFIYLGNQFIALPTISPIVKLTVSITSLFILLVILLKMLFLGIPSMHYSYTELTHGEDNYQLIMRQAETAVFAVERTENTLYLYKNKSLFPTVTDKQSFNFIDDQVTGIGPPQIPNSYQQLTDYLNQSKN